MSQIPSRAVLRTQPLSEKEVAAAVKEIAGVPLSDHARMMLGVLLVSRSEELCDPAALQSNLSSIATEVAQARKLWNSGDGYESRKVAHECLNEIFDLLPADPQDPLYCHALLTHHIELEFQTENLALDTHRSAVSRMVGAIDVPNLDAESDPKLQELTHIRRVVLPEAFEKLTEFENEADSSGPTKNSEASRRLKEAVAALKKKPIKQS